MPCSGFEHIQTTPLEAFIMTGTQQLTRWYYTLNYYVPITYPDKTEIVWELCSKDCEILLPSDVQDPAEYLRQDGYYDARDVISYEDFTTVSNW
jgi:hypothetical protein